MKKTYILRFRAVNRDIFEAILEGKKKVETRAATKKYIAIKTGDILVFVCGKERFEKEIKNVRVFKSITTLIKRYNPQEINPKAKSEKDLRDIYYSFPGYREKNQKFGVVAIELL